MYPFIQAVPHSWGRVPGLQEAEDVSFCDEDTQRPTYRVELTWADGEPEKTVDQVEIWRGSGGSFSEVDTASYGSPGERKTATTGVALDGTYDYKLRYQFDDGSHSGFSQVESVTVVNPC